MTKESKSAIQLLPAVLWCDGVFDYLHPVEVSLLFAQFPAFTAPLASCANTAPLTVDSFKLAAETGLVAALDWIVALHPEWGIPQSAADAGALAGHVAVLEWCRRRNLSAENVELVAAVHGHCHVLRWLRQQGRNPLQWQHTLWFAVKNKQAAVVTWLLRHGCKLNTAHVRQMLRAEWIQGLNVCAEFLTRAQLLEVAEVACIYGHKKALEWAFSRGQPLPPSLWLLAVRSGYGELVNKFHKGVESP